jgi:hypothetical protein
MKPLIDRELVEDALTHDAPWCETHGASGDYLGWGLLYYALTYATRAQLAVCLGSGGGFVPRMMRQAQRDAGIADSARTILVDGNVPEAEWGSPAWLDEDSFLRTAYPDIELVIARTSTAADEVFARHALAIDYLHIDADHSFDGCLADFVQYRPFLRVGSLVTLHDSQYPGAGVDRVVEYLRTRRDCELVDVEEAGTGTAVLRITSDVAPAAAPASHDDRAAVRLTRKPDPTALDPPARDWEYLVSDAFSVRSVLAAHFVRDCPTVIEIGGWRTPIDRHLTGHHTSVVVVDPFIEDAARGELNGAPCDVRHLRAGVQDVTWEVLVPGGYGLVMLGLDLERLSDDDERALFDLIGGAAVTVIEFPSSWHRSQELYARILAGTGLVERVGTGLDLAGNDFGDLSKSWPPRVERELHVLVPGRRASPSADGAAGDAAGEGGVLAGAGEWTAHGGDWACERDEVAVTTQGEEWVSLEAPHALRALTAAQTFAVDLRVEGSAEAAGVSFGAYRDLLAPLQGSRPRRITVEVDGAGGRWALRVDDRLAPRAWWNAELTSVTELLDRPLTLKARNARAVRFTGLAVRPLDGSCRVSVVLTCWRFLQRLRLALRTWCEQDLPAGAIEILVVNPESPDGTAEHLAAAAAAWQHVHIRELRVSAQLATNKGAMINHALDSSRGPWVWIADADCLFGPSSARTALAQAESEPSHLYYLRRQHLSAAVTAALLAGRLDPVRDFDHLAAATPTPPPEDRAPWGYTQLVPRTALDVVRYRDDVNHFAHSDETFAAACRRHGYSPRELDGVFCLHLEHPFAWNGTTGFL